MTWTNTDVQIIDEWVGRLCATGDRIAAALAIAIIAGLVLHALVLKWPPPGEKRS